MSDSPSKEAVEADAINSSCLKTQSTEHLEETEDSEKIQEPWQKVDLTRANINLRSPWQTW